MTTQEWTPTSQFAPAAEPSVWERIEDMYGEPFEELKAPAGYRFKMTDGGPDLRPLKEGDLYFPICGLRGPLVASCEDFPEPRLILEPIAPKPKRYVITLEETGEVRPAKRGEWFASPSGIVFCAAVELTCLNVRILRVVSREAK